EQCDDGNTQSGDGCSSVCTLEFCGDGVRQPGLGEACDGADADDGNACTVGDICKSDCSGIDLADPIAKDCDDGDACTVDGCIAPGGTCTWTPVVCDQDEICDSALGCIACLDSAPAGAL